MKQYKCVQVDHHERIPQVIEEYLNAGWVLHSYQAVNISMTTNVRHYLLFEKEDLKKSDIKPIEELSQKDKLEREKKLAKIREQIDKDIKSRKKE